MAEDRPPFEVLEKNEDGTYRVEMLCSCGERFVWSSFSMDSEVRKATEDAPEHAGHRLPEWLYPRRFYGLRRVDIEKVKDGLDRFEKANHAPA